MKNFKNLKVCQNGTELVVDVYKKLESFPRKKFMD